LTPAGWGGEILATLSEQAMHTASCQ
jgi:hypothetical protein